MYNINFELVVCVNEIQRRIAGIQENQLISKSNKLESILQKKLIGY